jgi:hypothetical protein
VIQPSPHKKVEVAKPKKDESLSSFTSDDEAKPGKYTCGAIIFRLAQKTTAKPKV